MQLPKEIYIEIFLIADDVEITKVLRCVCKLSLTASYDYFKILLRIPIIIYYDTDQWFLGEKGNVIKYHHCHPKINKSISFQTTIRELNNSLKQYNKRNMTFYGR